MHVRYYGQSYFDANCLDQVMNLEALTADAEDLESQFKDFLSRANLK